jgi:hypothetical protein
MQGCGVIADELLATADEGEDCPWPHVILQGGVSGMAAGIVGCFWDRYGERRPRFVVVEPEQAVCLLQSAIEGRPARAHGSVDSVMAGLALPATGGRPLHDGRRRRGARRDAGAGGGSAWRRAHRRRRVRRGGSCRVEGTERQSSGTCCRRNRSPLARAGDQRQRGPAPSVYAGIVGRAAIEFLRAQHLWQKLSAAPAAVSSAASC